jgi:filamentous hemagglutinin family protein
MNKAHKSTFKQIIKTIIGGTGIFCYLPTIQADVTFDGTMGSTGTLTGPHMEITAEMGQTAGNNLFHSFSEFNVNTGQTANFSGPNNIQNVFGRVTGSNPSTIDGTISSSIQGANLFLMNPNGMLFGPNAQINISGSFHATTADYIKLGDQDHFYADINQNTTLSVAAPSAFGFLDSDIGNIEIRGSNLALTDEGNHSLVGGDIIIDADPNDTSNNASISSSSGQISLVSVQSQGEVSTSTDDVEENDFANWGNVSIDNSSTIDTSGNVAGRIVIRGGELMLDNGSSLASNTIDVGTSDYANNIDVVTESSIELDNGSVIRTNADLFSISETKGISLSSERISLNNFSTIESYSDLYATSSSGDINIDTTQLELTNDSSIRTEAWGFGNSGSININAGTVNLGSYSIIETNVGFLGSGNGGHINVDANDIGITNYSRINTNTEGDGHGGNITFNTNELNISDGGQVRTVSRTDFRAGDINISSNTINLKGHDHSDDPFGDDLTGIFSLNQTWPSSGGNITITNSGDFILDSRSAVTVFSLGAENGANITIDSGKLDILQGARISIDASGAGNGNSGNIEITANELNLIGYHNDPLTFGNISLYDYSNINISGPSSLLELVSGDTGTVKIVSNNLNIKEGARIAVGSDLSIGTTGNIEIQAKNIIIDGMNETEFNSLVEAGYDNKDAGEQASSHIILKVRFNDLFIPGESPAATGDFEIIADKLQLSDGGYISTQSSGSSDSSPLNISVDELNMLSGGYITTSDDLGAGHGGNIDILATYVSLDGSVSKYTNTGIYSTTDEFSDRGGDITINTNSLTLKEGAVITSESTGDGNGGNIAINSLQIVQLLNSSVTAKASKEAAGNAGNIDIDTSLLILDGSEITTTAIQGNGGDITINTSNILVTDDSVIDASSEQSVNGNININIKDDVVSGLEQLTEKSDDVASKFKNECNNETGEYSSLAINKNQDVDITNQFSPSSYSIDLTYQSEPNPGYANTGETANLLPNYITDLFVSINCNSV